MGGLRVAAAGGVLAALVLLSGLWLPPAVVEGQAVEAKPGITVGEPGLQKLFVDALAKGAKQVCIPPGTYRLAANPGASAHLLFDNVQGMEIDGRGVNLVMTEPLKTLVYFRNCSGMRVRGITIDCDPLLFTQGRVAAVDPQGRWYDVDLEPGYRTDAEGFRNPRPMSVFHPKTREYKSRVADLFLGGIEQKDADTWRVLPVKEVIGRHRFPTDTVEVGDLVAIPASGGPAWSCRGCVDMRFEEITIYHSGNMAFHEHAGGGNTTLLHCRVLRKPGTTRLLSTCADGFHCKEMARGPRVEECLFEGMHDDGINIHGMWSRVLEAGGSRILMAPAFLEAAQPGDPVEFFREGTAESLGRFTVVSCARNQDPKYRDKVTEFWHFGYRFVYEMALDRAPDIRAGDRMASLGYLGSGFTIRNNTFRNHRYRAILVKGSSGLIEGNRIEGCSNDAIDLTPEMGSEASFVRSVVIRGNTIRHAGMLPWHQAAIRVGVDGARELPPAREHRDITIEGNTIEDIGASGILVTNASGVRIVGNRLAGIGVRRTSSAVPAAIRLVNAEKAVVTGNTITETPDPTARVVVDPSCDAASIRVEGNKAGAAGK